ncbi:hypothetical protein SK128_004363, partial [Halocaridina rubra]
METSEETTPSISICPDTWPAPIASSSGRGSSAIHGARALTAQEPLDAGLRRPSSIVPTSEYFQSTRPKILPEFPFIRRN